MNSMTEHEDQEKTSSSEHDLDTSKEKQEKKLRTIILSNNVNDYDTGEEEEQKS